jgi:hypothetical protein
MRTPGSIVLLLAVLAACAPSRVVTTPAPVPEAGSHIRYSLRYDPYRFTKARLLSLDADSLAFERFIVGDRHAWVADRVPTDSIARLQVRIDRRGNAGRGALIGGGIGLVLGALCSLGDSDNWLQPTPGECFLSGIFTGVGTGLLVGALSRSDVWAPVPLPGRGPEDPAANAPVTAAAGVDSPPE